MYLTGTLKWAVTKTPDQWGAYKIVIYPDEPSLEKVRDLQAKGLKNVLKRDEEGWFVSFRRQHSKEIRGKEVIFPPPEVLGPDGTPIDDLIGNGSKGTVKLVVYSHNTPGGGKAMAARFEALKINELVPYDNKQKDQQAIANDEPLF
jgi:hypothetical protein